MRSEVLTEPQPIIQLLRLLVDEGAAVLLFMCRDDQIHADSSSHLLANSDLVAVLIR